MVKQHKYFFKTIKDVNRDGLINKADKFHYYYLDFANDSYKIIEYYPLKIIGK